MRNCRVTRRGKTMVSNVSQSTARVMIIPAMIARASSMGSPHFQILDQKLIRCAGRTGRFNLLARIIREGSPCSNFISTDRLEYTRKHWCGTSRRRLVKLQRQGEAAGGDCE